MRASLVLGGLAAALLPFAALAAPSESSSPAKQHHKRRACRCTPETAVQRKEYGSLTDHEKLAYINGIKCLMAAPSRFAPGEVPASTNFFFDYAAVHANLTTSVHISGTFLSWHRHFLYLVEQALHDHCGYPAHLGIPYWDWTLYTDLESSPMFDGSPLSLGGNGVYEDTGPYVVGVGQELPHGTGGGCVTTGPFANTTVSLGPFAFSLIFTGLPSNWSDANPRCMTRDLNDYGIITYDNTTLVDQVLNASSIKDVQTLMNSKNVGTTDRGIHGGGHYAVGGNMFDFFASPLDPSFFLHHGNLDRVWTLWQDIDPATRRYQYNGTSTILNTDKTPEVTNSTVIDFYVLGESTTLEAVADPMSGPYCYIYV